MPTEPCGTHPRRSSTFRLTRRCAARPASSSRRSSLASTGQVVAEHVDPSSAAQTLYFPRGRRRSCRADTGRPPSDVRRPSDRRSDDPPDHGARNGRRSTWSTYSGLAPGLDYRADLTLFERLGRRHVRRHRHDGDDASSRPRSISRTRERRTVGPRDDRARPACSSGSNGSTSSTDQRRSRRRRCWSPLTRTATNSARPFASSKHHHRRRLHPPPSRPPPPRRRLPRPR